MRDYLKSFEILNSQRLGLNMYTIAKPGTQNLLTLSSTWSICSTSEFPDYPFTQLVGMLTGNLIILGIKMRKKNCLK